MTIPAVYDVLVLGAGPAGAAASLFAAWRGLKTAVVDRRLVAVNEPLPASRRRAAKPPQASPSPRLEHVDWLHPDAHALLKESRVASRDAVVGGLSRVRFIDPARAKQAQAVLDRRIDLADTALLREAMLTRAGELGAAVFPGCDIVGLEVGEQAVSLIAKDGRLLVGRVFVAADGSESLAARLLAPDRLAQSTATSVCCEWSAGCGLEQTAQGAPDELAVMLASEDLASFGYAFAIGETRFVGLVAPLIAEDIRARFDRTVAQWQAGGFLPAGVEPRGSECRLRRLRRGAALEMDSHVVKNGLLIGDAGGFVAAVSHEGLYPAVWSAKLAIDVCAEALQSKHTQDILIEFDARWRGEMVDYLRLPNADLRFLMPLIFTNSRMAHKLAQAFLAGINI
jgi:flavin-dependent dehydrogenase